MKWRKLASAVLAGAMVASIAVGCSGNTSASNSNAGQQQKTGQTVTLRIWGGVPPEAGPQKSIDEFNKAFKDKGIQA